MSKTSIALLAALLVVGGTTVVAAGQSFEQVGTPDCVTDPDDQDDPRAEVRRYCAVMDASGGPSFGIDVEQATDPGSDPVWIEGQAYWSVDIFTDSDSEADYRFRYDVEGGLIQAEIVDLTEYTSCSGTGSVEGNQYRAVGFAANCVGNAPSFRSGTTSFAYIGDGAFDIDTTGAVLSERGSSLPTPLSGGPAPTPPPPASPPPPPAAQGDPVFRLEGPTRIDTAIDISQYQFPDGASEVYLSRQDVFADSISSGSLTRGPILLVPSCGQVPQAVLDEVRRLDPDRVGALGGAAAVCDQVLTDVAAAAGL